MGFSTDNSYSTALQRPHLVFQWGERESDCRIECTLPQCLKSRYIDLLLSYMGLRCVLFRFQVLWIQVNGLDIDLVMIWVTAATLREMCEFRTTKKDLWKIGVSPHATVFFDFFRTPFWFYSRSSGRQWGHFYLPLVCDQTKSHLCFFFRSPRCNKRKMQGVGSEFFFNCSEDGIAKTRLIVLFHSPYWRWVCWGRCFFLILFFSWD